MKTIFVTSVFFVFTLLLFSCSRDFSALQDGYYTAETASFDAYGWKEFVTICVSNGKIITAEYNAKNPSGFIKSWDMDYMRRMGAQAGTYPNEYTRIYSSELLARQTPDTIDAISGATESHAVFTRLAAAAIEKARTGNTQVASVEIADK
jgi:major membrane immunogen (membrane-anchored lipoprotein)